MSIGIEAVIINVDSALVRDVRCHPSDNLHIIHLRRLGYAFPISLDDLALLPIEGKVFEGNKRAEHEKSR